MPVNFQALQNQIQDLGKQAVKQEKDRQNKREQALNLLRSYANRVNELVDLVQRAGRINSRLRCAIPLEEALDTAFDLPPLTEQITIIAADGSQIEPDRHAAVEFGLINTGAFTIQPGQPVAPTEHTESKLLYGDDLRPNGKAVGEELISLMRDIDERKMLASLAEKESLPVVTLTDGPLGLFREKEASAVQEYQKTFKEYLAALDNLSTIQAVTAGYVDRPRADLVVRMLELTQLSEAGLSAHTTSKRLLEGVLDADLYTTLLQPGQRSAVFAIQSPSAQEFKDHLALRFFYLNVGNTHQPSIARVEIPAWVADYSKLLNRLHAALMQQCQVVSAHPFPYALHRAHEVAVVTHQEKEQLEAKLAKTLIEEGFLPPSVSNKQFLKNIFGKRARYTP